MTPQGRPGDEHGDDLSRDTAPGDDSADRTADDATAGEAGAQDAMHTQVFQRGTSQPTGGVADMTMSDFSLSSATGGSEGPGDASKSGGTANDEDEEEDLDRTRVQAIPDRAGRQDAGLPPPPPPFPWAQQPPGAPPVPHAPPSPPLPTAPPPPPAFDVPAPDSPAPGSPAAQPPAAQPPGPQQAPPPPPPADPPPAPTPFPYAQEIPDTPRTPPASEPFPYAQEIPGESPAPPPFPWAQEVPGPGASPDPVRGNAPAASPPPVAPPPEVDEPWRTVPRPKGRRKGIGKKVAFGVAGGLATAALIATGVVVLLGRDGGSDTAGEGARLAGGLFAADPAARADGRDQELTGVAASGSTVVAVGGEADPGNYRGVFLVSTDGGRTFETAEVEGGDEPGTSEIPRVLTAGQGGWIAIGTRPGGGVVWTSEDGRTWRRQPDAAGDVFGPGNRVTRVISTSKGYLAIGEHSRKHDFTDSVPALWLSADGRRWDALTGGQVGIQIRGHVVLEGIASSGDVVLMGSAHTPEPDKPSFRRAWRSTDGGRTWSPAQVPAPKGTRGLKVGGGQAGLVAVREVKSGKSFYGQVYTSKDAEDWRKAGKLSSSGYREVQELLGTDSGYAGIIRRGRDLLISRSADGRSWQDAGTLPIMSGRMLLGASAAGGQTIMVGRDPGNGDLNALLAVRDERGTEVESDPLSIPGAFRKDQAVTAVAANDATAVAVGSTGGDAAIWTSADGAAWNRARFSGGISRPALQRLTSVVSGGGGGWLAVGDGGGLPRSPLVLTSADGTVWRPVDNAPVFERRGSHALATFGAAAGPSGYVVVGDDGPSGAIWFSPDLRTWQRGSGVRRNDLAAEKNGNRWVRAAAGGTFGFVAAGGMLDPKAGGVRRPAIWTSSDGKKWRLQPIELSSGLAQGSFTHLAAKGDVLVAAGDAVDASGPIPLGYVSTDAGRSWRETKLPMPEVDGPFQITAVAATPKGFVVTGTAGNTGTSDVVSWTSADGAAWTVEASKGDVLAGPGRQEITGLAPFKNTLLGVGRSIAQSEEQPVLWSRDG